jgi:hypothetical protein
MVSPGRSFLAIRRRLLVVPRVGLSAAPALQPCCNWHSDGTYTPGTAEDWCLSSDHDKEPLWCGHQIHEKMAVYQATLPNVNVVDLQWSPTAPAIDHTYEVVAHDANEDPDPNPDRVHLLKLRVADGLWYFVEVRQAPAGLVFDQHLPLPAGVTAAVLGLDRGERGRWGGSGHRAPPERAETQEAGPAGAPAIKRKTHRKVRPLVTPGHKPQQLKSKPAALEMLEIADSAR